MAADESMNDISQIHEEDSLENESSTEDLQFTLSEAMALRKNLEPAFAKQVKKHEDNAVQAKIAHFEKQAAAHAATAQMRPPLLPKENSQQVQTKLSVYLRLRPPHSKKAADSQNTIEILTDAPKIRTHPPETSNAAKVARGENAETVNAVKEYEFTSVFGPETGQLQVYQRTAAPLVQGLFSGHTVGKSALLFCYGITNAGKTHTVLGDLHARKQKEWGLVPRALDDIFNKLHSNRDLQLHLSYFELYNEQIFDLLPDSKATLKSEPLKVRERNGQAVVPGLAKHRVQSLQEGLELASTAKHRRHTATNNLNRDSSRSHCICQLTLSIAGMDVVDDNASVSSADQATVQTQQANLWIVDLAGSERSKRTAVGTVRQKEAAHINKSLMTLMRCLNAMRENQSSEGNASTIVPYRESKLTVLFMNHLTGPAACNTAMIVNVNPAACDYDETQHVLGYASASKTIQIARTEPIQTSSTTVEYGYDGRRKEPSKNKKESAARKVAKFVKNLSPKLRVNKREDRKRKATRNHVAAHGQSSARGEPAAKKMRPVQATKALKNAPDDKESKNLQMSLSIARAEIEILNAKNEELTAELDEIETQVRAEVAEEMEAQMEAIRDEYQQIIDDLKSKMNPLQTKSAKKIQMDKAEQKMDELLCKVEECEEEMERMREEHETELENAKTEYDISLSKREEELQSSNERVAKLEEEVKRLETAPKENKFAGQDDVETVANEHKVQTLEQDLAASRAEIDRLRRSKEELIENYEKLLQDDDEADDDDTEEQDEVEREEEDGDDEDDESTMTNRRITRQYVKGPPREQVKQYEGSERSSRRNPLGTISSNAKPFDTRSTGSDDSFGPAQWLYPKKSAKKDPKLGTFQRPRGRAPSGAEAWDEHRGAWRLSSVALGDYKLHGI